MKTTLNIDDGLLASARTLAAQQQTTLTRLVEEGLRLRLHGVQLPQGAGKRRLPVFEGCGGLVDALDGTSNKAMLDALAGGEDA